MDESNVVEFMLVGLIKALIVHSVVTIILAMVAIIFCKLLSIKLDKKHNTDFLVFYVIVAAFILCFLLLISCAK